MVRGAVGDHEVDPEAPKRGYTTRAKEEQRRTAAPAFTGRVRRWERRWTRNGHLKVLRWERVEAGDGTEAQARNAEMSPKQTDEPPNKRPRN